MPSIGCSDDASLSTEGEGIAEMIEQFSCEHIHHKDSCIEVSQWKLKSLNKSSLQVLSLKLNDIIKTSSNVLNYFLLIIFSRNGIKMIVFWIAINSFLAFAKYCFKMAYFSEKEVGETESTNELLESPVSVESVIGSHQDVLINGLLEVDRLEWSKKLIMQKIH